MVRVLLDYYRLTDQRPPIFLYTYDAGVIYRQRDLYYKRELRLVNGYWYVLEGASHDTTDPSGFYGGNSVSGYLRWLLYDFSKRHWYVDVDDFIMAVTGGSMSGSFGGCISTHTPYPQDIGKIIRVAESDRMMRGILEDRLPSILPPTMRNVFTGRWSSFGADYAYDPQTGRVDRVGGDSE